MFLLSNFDRLECYSLVLNVDLMISTKHGITSLLVILFSIHLQGQSYFGAGNDIGVTVTSSSQEGIALAENTMNGKGMDAKLFEASRFLSQAGFGASKADIEILAETLDFETWLTDQYNLPVSSIYNQLDEIFAEMVAEYTAIGIPEEEVWGPASIHFNYAWWQNLMTEEDQLRQKVAMALSEIVVISKFSAGGFGRGLASYYDIFMNNAFGNYEDILLEATLHPDRKSVV